jgi:hypothetical protein
VDEFVAPPLVDVAVPESNMSASNMSAARKKLVVQVFNGLDGATNNDGVLTTEGVSHHFDAEKHPSVVADRIDAGTALRSFLEGLGYGPITLKEWMANYESISDDFKTDDSFGQMMAGVWGRLHAKGSKTKAAVTFVPSHEIDVLEGLLFEATYRRRGGSNYSQWRLLTDTFKQYASSHPSEWSRPLRTRRVARLTHSSEACPPHTHTPARPHALKPSSPQALSPSPFAAPLFRFDLDGSGCVSQSEFLKAVERFGLHVRGKGRTGIGGLPESSVLALFDRYDVDASGTLSFKEFASAFLERHQTVSDPLEADEFKAKSAPSRDADDDSDAHLRHPKKKHDHELFAARQNRQIGGKGMGGYLSQAAKIHGSKSGTNKGGGHPFK